MKKILLLGAFALVLVSFTYNTGGSRKKGLLKGEEVTVHGGKAWTWTQLNKKGQPQQVGFTLTDEVLNTVPMPTAAAAHGHMAHSMDNYWIVKFNPEAGAVVPFKFMLLNWNQNGHEPVGIYDKPHFDFHFYSSTPEQVDAIGPYEVDSVKFNNVPGDGYLPENYVNTGHSFPKMGAHWVDVKSPELHGTPFTETFIYGSFDGEVTFYEPMITLEFLKTQKNYERKIPTPTKFKETGWYPTSMKIVKHDGQTDIILNNFVYRQKS
jgi:hypothetical protein